jgi:serine/threonine-protein kinase
MLPVLLSALASALLPVWGQPARGKKYALVVGINVYEHTKLSALQFAENDATDLGKVLRRAGYEVVVLTGSAREAPLRPTRANIGERLKEVLGKCRRGDTALVALAGHGLQFAGKRDAFFCPVDARPFGERSDSLLSLNEVYRQMDQSLASIKLLLVDACRNDPESSRGVDDSAPRPPRGIAALFSCSAGERAFETEKLGGGHGVFFHFVLEALRGKAKNSKGAVTWNSLVGYVTDQVSDEVPRVIRDGAKQTPHQMTDLKGKSPVLLGREEDEQRPDQSRVERPPGGARVEQPAEPPGASSGSFGWLWWGGGTAAALAVLGVVLVRRRRRAAHPGRPVPGGPGARREGARSGARGDEQHQAEASDQAHALLSGRYQVLRQLGKGGMGVVYLAQDHTLGCEVVIKMPLRSVLDEPGFADRFSREIRSMVLLAHPHVVKIQDVGCHDGVPFCVLQYLPGGSLQDRPLPADPASLQDWLPAVAGALDFVHGQGFLHRDIKPDNILFDAHGNAYISDFGVAKVLSDKAAKKGATQLTGEGLVVGTIGYLAPELIMGAQKVTGQADQYALAATVYKVLAGRLPFVGNSDAAILVQQAAGKMPPLRQFAPHLPPGLGQVIARGLSKDPAQRFPSCTAFAEAVLQLTSPRAASQPASARAATPPKLPGTKGGSPPALPAGAKSAGRLPGSAEAPGTSRPAPRTGRRPEPAPGGGRGVLIVAGAILAVGAAVGGVFAYRALRARPDPSAPSAPTAPEAFRFRPLAGVTVQPGTPTYVPIRIVRVKYEGPVQLVCERNVAGVSLSEGTIGPGQSEVSLKLEVAEGTTGSLDVPLKGVAEGVAQSVVLRLLVLPPPQFKVELPDPLPRLRIGAPEVSVRVRIARTGYTDLPGRFSVNTDDLPAQVIVVPTSNPIRPGQEGFDIRVQALADAPKKQVSLPITVFLKHPTRKLQQQVVLQLRVE